MSQGTQFAGPGAPRTLEEVRALDDIFVFEDTAGPVDPELVELYEQLLIVIPAEVVAGTAAKAATKGASIVRSTTQLGPKVVFGRNANQISHTFRHVDAAGLDRGAVEAAVRGDLRASGALSPGKLRPGTVQVGGRTVQYNAFKLPDGTINVGRITVQ